MRLLLDPVETAFDERERTRVHSGERGMDFVSGEVLAIDHDPVGVAELGPPSISWSSVSRRVKRCTGDSRRRALPVERALVSAPTPLALIRRRCWATMLGEVGRRASDPRGTAAAHVIPVLIVGHSIGGNLAVSLALRLREKGAALPGAILSISPWIDIAMTSRTIGSNADLDKLLSRPLLEFFRASWLDGTGVEWNDPRVNLLSADLSGLPPIAVYYGTDELLAGEAFEFGLRASAAGNDIFLRPVPAGQHSFIIGAGRVPEVDHAVTEMGRWLRSKLRAA